MADSWVDEWWSLWCEFVLDRSYELRDYWKWNEWMNNWMNEQMNGQKNKWKNEKSEEKKRLS